MAEQYNVTSLTRLGEGIAQNKSGDQVLVHGGLPGDSVTGLLLDGVIDTPEHITKSPDHLEPPCPDYGKCGGCSFQHAKAHRYAEWKRGLLIAALSDRGIEANIGQLQLAEPASRRRASFSIRHTQSGVELGFQKARSHEIVVFEDCKVILPVLNKARGAIKALAKAALPLMAADAKPTSALVTVTKTGLDVALSNVERLNSNRREAALQIALKANFARLSINGELIVETRKPIIEFDGLPVRLPAGAFLQAVQPIENAMRDLVAEHLKGTKRVADLFSGCGTFTLPLARAHHVHAVEMEQASLNALDQAWRASEGLKTVTTDRRDLFERPLKRDELDQFDGLVFDPPRSGAAEQAAELANSSVERVVAVSCNPETLARDLKTLVAGGYQIKSVTPFDQFIWTHHLEAVALLDKPRRKATKAARQGW
ncbi:MAG: RNA methyltransferase [Pseudomonadota bacterium]